MSKNEWLSAAPTTATNFKAQTPLFPFLIRLVRGESLSFAEASDFYRALTDYNANAVQIAGALTALTSKGENHEELAGMASVMRSQAVRINTRKKVFLDISGTGLSTAKTFNVSTAAAFAAAGAGLAVAKHGNRGGMSKSGSADVLAKLGVKVSSEPESAQACFNGAGICFMFSPKFHPASRRISDVRRSLGIRTCLNVLGTLSNPARAPRQIIGVWHRSLVESGAKALSLLGTERSWVVHGSDGLDELTISGETHVCEVAGDSIRSFTVSPEDFGIQRAGIDALKTQTPEQSARIIRDVLASKRRDEARSLVVLNAAAALFIGGVADDPVHAARLAEQAIDSGQAQNKLERLVQTTNKNHSR